jgi:TatD DNase family protein
MIDTHCHLTHHKLRDDEREIVDRAREAGLDCCISIGTGNDDAARVRELTGRHPGFVFGTAGLDPFSSHDAGEGFDDAFALLGENLRAGGFVAVGEIGLDYHYDLDPRPLQAERFERQLDLAVDLDLPVVIHVRDAHEDMASILSAHSDSRGVIHSFTGGPVEAEAYLALGWYLAFNGVMTFPKSEAVREAARLCPAERLLIETDAPYLAPVPMRGRRCEPGFVAHTLDRLVEVRGAGRDEIETATTENARRLFSVQSSGS